MDEPAESITTRDRAVLEAGWRVGGLEREAAMGTLVVLVLEVLDEDAAEVMIVADQDPVEAL